MRITKITNKIVIEYVYNFQISLNYLMCSNFATIDGNQYICKSLIAQKSIEHMDHVILMIFPLQTVLCITWVCSWILKNMTGDEVINL